MLLGYKKASPFSTFWLLKLEWEDTHPNIAVDSAANESCWSNSSYWSAELTVWWRNFLVKKISAWKARSHDVEESSEHDEENVWFSGEFE